LTASLWESGEDPFELAVERTDEAALSLAVERDDELDSEPVQPLWHSAFMDRLRGTTLEDDLKDTRLL
jgi:hypothetical protein